MPLLFLVGRILLGVFFLDNAYNHFKNSGALSGYALSKNVPMPKVAVLGSGALLLIGGVSMILGFYPHVGIAALVLFLVPVTYTMHAFWKEQDQARQMDRIQFMKNMAILGAILMLLSLPLPWAMSISGM